MWCFTGTSNHTQRLHLTLRVYPVLPTHPLPGDSGRKRVVRLVHPSFPFVLCDANLFFFLLRMTFAQTFALALFLLSFDQPTHREFLALSYQCPWSSSCGSCATIWTTRTQRPSCACSRGTSSKCVAFFLYRRPLLFLVFVVVVVGLFVCFVVGLTRLLGY